VSRRIPRMLSWKSPWERRVRGVTCPVCQVDIDTIEMPRCACPQCHTRLNISMGYGTTKRRKGGMLSQRQGRTTTNVVMHFHKGRGWYLCDRSYVHGHRRHMTVESYGKQKPTLYPPKIIGPGMTDLEIEAVLRALVEGAGD